MGGGVGVFLAATLILVTVLAALALFPVRAWAEEGLVPQVTGSFDKESYETNESAIVTFRVANSSGTDWSGVRLEARLPQGVKLADASVPAVIAQESLAAGDILELRVPVAFEPGFFATKLAPTGDNTLPGGLALAAVAALAFALVAAGTLSRDRARRHKTRAGMSVLVVVVLVVGLAPVLPAVAYGDEEDPAEPTVFLGEAVCASPNVAVTGAFTIEDSNETTVPVANVTVADGQAVSANAKYAQVEVVSDSPFASDLSADTIALEGSFEGLNVASVTRTGDNAAAVRVEGGPGAAGNDGFIVFNEGSFADESAVGGVAVSVEAATLSFDADGSSYENGAFTLPVSVENGRFADTASTQDWLFADGTGLTAASFAVNPDDDRCGTLTVSASQSNATDQVSALSAALNTEAPQLTLAPTALAGEAAAGMSTNVIEGRADTLAEAARAVPYGSVEATDVVHNADESLTVSNHVTLSALDGSVHLTSIDQITLPGQEDILPGQEDKDGLLENSRVTIREVSEIGFDFTFDIDSETVKGWYDPFMESGQTEENAEMQFLEELTQLMCGHEVDLADGVVLNAYGIAQGESSVCLSDAASLNQLAGAEVARSSEENAKKAFEALEKIAGAIGWFSEGGEGAAHGIGELFGLIATMIDPTPEVTLQDIYDELQQMKGQLSRMETSIDRMAVELQAVDKRAGFDSEWYEVKWRIDHLSSYGGLYTTLTSKLKVGSAADDLATVMADNEKLLGQYANAIDKKDKLLGTTVFTDTRDLGTMILGTGQTDIVGDYYKWLETYYNWDPETFPAKDEYLASVTMAYLYGYGASMAYLNVKASQEEDDDPFGDNVYADAKDELKVQAGQVVRKLAGEVGTDENGMATIAKKSAYRQATEPLPNENVRNLLNDRHYPKANHFLQDIYAGTGGFFSASVEKDRLYPYTFNGDINLAQYEQMAANLPQVRGLGGAYAEATSLWKELGALGFKLDEGATDYNHKDWQSSDVWVYWHLTDRPLSMVAVGDATYHKLKDQTAIQHIRSMTLDVFDMQTNQVVRDVMVSHHEEHWSCGYSEWQYKHDIYPVRNILDHYVY